jgi:hypothetical protein
MKLKIIFFSVLINCYISAFAFGQELNCQVTVVVDNQIPLTSIEKEVFDILKQTVYEMMNNTKWTKEKYKLEERINCNIQIQISSIPSSGTYVGSIQVQSTRPAFNSSYNSTILNYQDDNLSFAFTRNSILIYSPNQYRDELTSILAFYAYYIIGMDADSFSAQGGTQYFTEAQQIVSLAQSSGSPGWASNDTKKRNRFYLVDNILQQLFEPLRACNYQYHRKGIDLLYEDQVKAKANMYQALSLLNKVVSTRPNSINLLNFVQAKQIEIKNVFAEAEQTEKNEIVNLLKKIDPANSSKYQEILE